MLLAHSTRFTQHLRYSSNCYLRYPEPCLVVLRQKLLLFRQQFHSHSWCSSPLKREIALSSLDHRKKFLSSFANEVSRHKKVGGWRGRPALTRKPSSQPGNGGSGKTSQKAVFYTIIGLNVLVFGAWQIAKSNLVSNLVLYFEPMRCRNCASFHTDKQSGCHPIYLDDE